MRLPVLWIDVGELADWHHSEVSGIQRVLASVVAEAALRPPRDLGLGFCRLDSEAGLLPVTKDEVLPRVRALLALPPVAPGAPRGRGPLPDAPRAGDTYLNLGTPWSHPGRADLLGREKARLGLRCAQLIYDVEPALSPPVTPIGRLFTDWLTGLLPLLDSALVVSRYSQGQLERWAAAHGLPLPAPRLVRLGVGLRPARPPAHRAELAPLLAAGGYLLTVGRLGPGKNHQLTVRALALLAERGRPLPPVLWLGRSADRAELDAALAAAPDVARRVTWLEGVDDHDLALAYARCRAVIVASRFEGYGLPLAEALAFGRPCLAASGTALPEVGGRFADYFASDDAAALASLIERYCRPGAAWRRAAWIRLRHRPVRWRTAAPEILRAALA